MKLERHVAFTIPSSLDEETARAFVQDVSESLSHATFLTNLKVSEEDVVSAHLPVNAALFGQQRLRFRSQLERTPDGGRLHGEDLDDAPGWARVCGTGVVVPTPTGSRLEYTFDFTIHVALPEGERWGGRALLKMIEVVADNVLRRVTESFPKAVTDAARAYEARLAA